MVEAGFSSYCRVDVLQELFANLPDLAFGRVNKSASGFVLKDNFFVTLMNDKAASIPKTMELPGDNKLVLGNEFLTLQKQWSTSRRL